MFNIGKTTHDSIESAVNEAVGGDAENNCAQINYETPDKSFTVQLKNKHESDEWLLNLSSLHRSKRGHVHEAVDLDVEDEGRMYIIFRSTAETAGEAIAEIETIASAVGGTRAEVASTCAFETAHPDETPLDALKALIGLGA